MPRHLLAGLSISGVRRVEYADLLRLMERAERCGRKPHGNRPWLEARRDDVAHCYLVRLPQRNHRGFVKCALVIIDNKNRGVWMNLDVRRRFYLRLPRIRSVEMENLMLNLAVRLPIVRRIEDPLFDPDAGFG